MTRTHLARMLAALLLTLASCKPTPPPPVVALPAPTPTPTQPRALDDLQVPYLTPARIEAFLVGLKDPVRLRNHAGPSRTMDTLTEWMKERDAYAIKCGFANYVELYDTFLRIGLAESHLRREEGRLASLEEMRATITKLENELVGEKDPDTIRRKQLIVNHCRGERETMKHPYRCLIAVEDVALWKAARPRVDPFALYQAGIVHQ